MQLWNDMNPSLLSKSGVNVAYKSEVHKTVKHKAEK
jgi:hypothetical protein